MKTLKVSTSTVYKYRGKGKLDITVKSGERIFAPTWSMVMGHKSGKISDTEYTSTYRKMMVQSYHDNLADWRYYLNSGELVLCCYCRPGEFCHRHLLKQVLAKLCEMHNIEFIDGGEI